MKQRPPLRILVCGGRDFDERAFIYRCLDRLHRKRGIALLIHGKARGADYHGGAWARSRGVPEMPFPADWKGLGKAAGPVRNTRMLHEGRPDGVVAFPGGAGTADMRAKAAAAGLPIWEPL